VRALERRRRALDTYRDPWIECTADEVRIRGYYFPWGTKRIPYGSIRGLRRVQMSATRGRYRIWGTANMKYWASLDPKRPTKSTGFVVDLGRAVSPFVTPDDPDAFEAAVRAHVDVGPAAEEPPHRGPVV
jgi:hypothetical protein